jgi:hypothetical protein
LASLNIHLDYQVEQTELEEKLSKRSGLQALATCFGGAFYLAPVREDGECFRCCQVATKKAEHEVKQQRSSTTAVSGYLSLAQPFTQVPSMVL